MRRGFKIGKYNLTKVILLGKRGLTMGMIGQILGGSATQALGTAASDMAEIFAINQTRRMERSFDAQEAALAQHGVEFNARRLGWFDRLVNGLNRLPRPMLALGTLGLFVYAMVDPIGFSGRMAGLAHVPQPLWWLLGAIVSFYFGARELHYFRAPSGPAQPAHRLSAWQAEAPSPEADNPALTAWRQGQDAAD